jgi:hypothetical protein
MAVSAIAFMLLFLTFLTADYHRSIGGSNRGGTAQRYRNSNVRFWPILLQKSVETGREA